jgi:chromate reductase
MPTHLVGISGSLRKDSNNSKLIEIASTCTPKATRFTIVDCLGELPHFNPDIDIENFDTLKQWVALVRESDGLVISTPEYARGYPGTLKNALDWLVQTDAHIDKPFMMLNASDRSKVARESLIVVLETMSGIYVEDASITIPILGKSLSVDQLSGENDVIGNVKNALIRFVDKIGVEEGGT